MNSRNHITIQKFVTFLKNNLKINMLKIKNYCKIKDRCHYTGKYRGAARSTCNLKYSDLKKILQFFKMDATVTIILQ